MNQCSRGISLDGEGRIWVVTLNRQLDKTEQSAIITRPGMKKRIGSESEEPQVIEKLEIFDIDGVLLGELLISHRVHFIRVWGSIILLLDITESKIYQYEIKNQ